MSTNFPAPLPYAADAPVAGGAPSTEASELLKQKAVLLLQREHELSTLRMRHQGVTAWLGVAQSLPQIVKFGVGRDEVFSSVARALLRALNLQRAMFFELNEGALWPKGSRDDKARALAPEALERLSNVGSGFCNGGCEGADRVLAQALGLARFMWVRLEVPGLPPVLAVVGFDAQRAEFYAPFNDFDTGQFANMAQHLCVLLRNSLLVSELEQDKARLAGFNEALERRVAERTQELGQANQEIASALSALREKDRRLSEDLQQARDFQQRILPVLPSSRQIELAVEYRPMDLVGGDIYDVWEAEPGRYRFFVADATGHGVQASLRTILIKLEYDRIKAKHPTPATLLEDFNQRLLVLHPDGEMLCSACCFDVDLREPSAPVLRCSNAGNPALLRLSKGELSEIWNDGPLLGAFANATASLIEVPLFPGDILLAHTDGLSEQRDESGKMFDLPRAVLHSASQGPALAPLMNQLWREFLEFVGSRAIADDIASVAVRLAS